MSAPSRPVERLSLLRRHQRRLLFGGGLLVTVLILSTAAISILLGIREFHSGQRQQYLQAREALDLHLSQRDRAYASTINANDALWGSQRDVLERNGEPLRQAFVAAGEQLVVRAPGKTAVPWLVLGRDSGQMPAAELAAYMGLIQEYSSYAAVSITALQAGPTFWMYVYDPSRRLLAVTGVRDEVELLQALKVGTRAQAFERLTANEVRLAGVHPAAGPLQSAYGQGRMVSFLGQNPMTQRPALVGMLTLAAHDEVYFRHVNFERLDQVQARLAAASPGAFVLVTNDGQRVLASGAVPADAEAALRGLSLPLQQDAPLALHEEGLFMVAGPIRGVDWTLVHFYRWSDLLADQRDDLLLRAGATLLILGILWGLLLLLDRRVFAPALADASRVYESEALSRTIIEATPVGLCLLDPSDGTPLAENEVAHAIAAHAPALRPLYAGLAAHVHRQADAAPQEFHWTLDSDDGSARQLQVVMAAASYQDQPVWVCALRDVTAQMELQEKLDAAREDAERARLAAESASRAKSAFVATMSHEIRTPLNGVLGHLELLSRSRLEPAQHEHLDRIRLSADALMATISDVLDFSKIEVGQLDIDPVPFGLRGLIEQSALLYAPAAQQKGLKLFHAVDPGLAASYVADAHRIGQILNNLLSNAIKFTDDGRVLLRVLPAPDSTDAAPLLRFQVVDSGIGMTAAQMEHVFQPFSQADASISRRYGGTGLGLALCQQLAQLLGGDLQADSTPGVGSLFTLDVPAAPAADTAAAATPLQGVPVTLLSAAAEWRAEFDTLLAGLGATLTVLDRPRSMDGHDAVLVIVGERRAWSEEEEQRLVDTHARVVRAHSAGPLVARQVDGQLQVSCYSSSALVDAILAQVPSPSPQSAPPLAALGQRGRVLLVEDNPVNRELIQQQLEELGFLVDTANNGQLGLQRWQPGHYAAVLTDINMPVMNGYELAQALRGRGEQRAILAITATALSSERERCRAAGITDLLLKPMSLAALDRMLTRHVGPAPATAPAAEPLQPAASPVPARPFPPRVLRLFVDSGRGDLDQLQQALDAGDAQRAIDRLHAFKGALQMLGEQALAQRCGVFELDLRATPVQALQGPLRTLADDLAAVLDAYAARLD
ncbi:ATP-binding protein [Stenotrophomonas rhizophila]|uniref:hybrid sensor histidine kinase/response regulator n=1 Tax=Stenotrophomonas rhizophila TaxID=216778 RepID=UPI002A6B0F3A|nr:ATP-binding protein [Stenotrophomonas rhizophila]MDY0955674.1 ATP-binding protein [Stenotrophomonas rhizophila]